MGKLKYENLTNLQKIAILMVILGDEITSKVFSKLDEEEIADISREITLLGPIPAEISERIMEEFYNMAIAKQYIAIGGIEYAKGVLIKALGPEQARKIIDRLVKLLEKSVGFASLEKVNPQQISKFIQNEHPQTIALILAHLSASRAAELLESLPEDIRAEIAIRMANLEEISPDIVKKISFVLDQRLQSLGSYKLEEYGGVKAVADLLNRMERRVAKQILEQIEVKNPELAVQVRDMMFVFEDILLIDDHGIAEILKRIDKKSLAIALKGASDELKEKFFRNMSQRAVEMLKEEMEYMGPIRVKDVEKAQHEIVEVVRELEEEGVVSIGGGGGEEYIV